MRAAVLLVTLTACGGWSRRDTLLEIGAQASLVADWRQTRAVVERAQRDGSMTESNPLIGDHGQVTSPDGYFLTVGLLHVAIAAALPPRLRLAFQAATIGLQSHTVITNHLEFEKARRDDPIWIDPRRAAGVR